MDLFDQSGAQFSSCRRYRLRLWRRWGDGPALNFIGLNPSVADEATDDPTVVRMERRARMWGYPALVVTNLFAWRSTDPGRLSAGGRLFIDGDMEAVLLEAKQAAMVLCGWGRHGGLLGRGEQVEGTLREAGVPLYVLRLCRGGEPQHPLYLPYALWPVRWE